MNFSYKNLIVLHHGNNNSLFDICIKFGSRKISPEENCPLALILTLILNQTLTLTGEQFSGHHQIHTFNNNLNDEGIITSHLMRVIFYDKNVTTFSRMIEKPWQNMLHEKTILKG